MARLYELGYGASHALELTPGGAAGTPTRDRDETNCATVAGEYKVIGGVLHALYGSGGRLWIRIGDVEWAVTEPADVSVRREGDVLIGVIPRTGAGEVVIREPVPAPVDTDPIFDFLASTVIFWIVNVQETLRSQEAMDRYWGGARHLS